MAATKTASTNLETIRIKVSQISDNPENARKDMTSDKALAGIKALAEEIKVNGLIHPITVIRTDDPKKPYQVRAGSRRLAAVNMIDPEGEIDARVSTVTEPGQLALQGLAENLDREDITPHDAAVEFARVSDKYGFDGSYIAKRVGKSKNLVNNYIRVVHNVHPKIQAQWAAGNAMCNMENMMRLAGIKNEETGKPDHDAQWERWLVMTGASTDDDDNSDGGGADDGGDAGGDDVKPEEKRAAKKAAMQLLGLILDQHGKDSKPWVPAIQTLQYVLGARKSLPAGLKAAPSTDE